MTATISQLFGFNQPSPYPSKHPVNKESVQPERLVGIELEIEELNPGLSFRFPGFAFTNDNSLRNSDEGVAKEAVSLPLRLCDAPGILNAFWKAFKIEDKNFSERCSIHVHVNALDMTVEQVASLCLVYQTVERLLFEFIGEGRKDNIFCVPWHQSGLTYNYVNELIKDPNRRARSWQKYTALNLIPLTTQGTLEFRHLHGTADLKKIGNWLQLVGCLFEYAVKTPLTDVTEQILTMNTISNYREWLTWVFSPTHSELLIGGNQYETALTRGVIDSKFLISAPKESTDKIVHAPQALTMDEVQAMLRTTLRPRAPQIDPHTAPLPGAWANTRGPRNPFIINTATGAAEVVTTRNWVVDAAEMQDIREGDL